VTAQWLALGLAALIVGFSKTAIGGMGAVAVALFASALPARESTAAALLVLLVGDALAVSRYWHDADWRLIRALLPAVVPGLLLGAAVLAVIDDQTLKRLIGAIIAVLLLCQLVLLRRGLPDWVAGRWSGSVAGGAVGFTTMTANSAGSVMTLFLVSRRVEKLRFVGTGAWFFLVVNLCKVPFSAGLGLFSPWMFVMALVLSPLVVVGAALGVALVRRIPQAGFDTAVISASALSAVLLLVS
jgi:uncharacterized membrane protein YfcA